MIPKADIVAWRQHAPWVSDAQIEQDLALSRALVAIFADDTLAAKLAFRGGTALHKLYFKQARRYSEDIDLVQIVAGPIGRCARWAACRAQRVSGRAKAQTDRGRGDTFIPDRIRRAAGGADALES